MNNSSLFSIRLKNERIRLGLTQIEIAKSCNLSREMWGKYERGVALAGSEVLFSLAAIGVDIGYLFTGQRIEDGLSATPREAALLDNYRAAPEDGKRALEMSALAFAAGMPQPHKPAKTDKKAAGGLSIKGDGNIQIGGSLSTK